jgi:hypothetical protein
VFPAAKTHRESLGPLHELPRTFRRRADLGQTVGSAKAWSRLVHVPEHADGGLSIGYVELPHDYRDVGAHRDPGDREPRADLGSAVTSTAGGPQEAQAGRAAAATEGDGARMRQRCQCSPGLLRSAESLTFPCK